MFLDTAKRTALEALSTDGVVGLPLGLDSARQNGIGYAVAKGWAVYRGGGDFEVTEAGKTALYMLNKE